jgi:regulator of RNase E activity RraA
VHGAPILPQRADDGRQSRAARRRGTLYGVDLIERLLGIDVSALSDADKTLPVLDPAVRSMIPEVRMAGPAFTVVAEDDHLPVMSALAEASPGDVLVIATGGGTRAVFGELFATEARRRGLAGIVADGLCRDLRGLRRIGLPVFARGTTPRSGTVVSRATLGATVSCGGVDVSPGDIVFGDDDGVLVATAERIAAALDAGEAIGRAEHAILAAQARGEALHALTNHAEHVAALDRGESSALAFRVDA